MACSLSEVTLWWSGTQYGWQCHPHCDSAQYTQRPSYRWWRENLIRGASCIGLSVSSRVYPEVWNLIDSLKWYSILLWFPCSTLTSRSRSIPVGKHETTRPHQCFCSTISQVCSLQPFAFLVNILFDHSANQNAEIHQRRCIVLCFFALRSSLHVRSYSSASLSHFCLSSAWFSTGSMSHSALCSMFCGGLRHFNSVDSSYWISAVWITAPLLLQCKESLCEWGSIHWLEPCSPEELASPSYVNPPKYIQRKCYNPGLHSPQRSNTIGQSVSVFMPWSMMLIKWWLVLLHLYLC